MLGAFEYGIAFSVVLGTDVLAALACVWIALDMACCNNLFSCIHALHTFFA